MKTLEINEMRNELIQKMESKVQRYETILNPGFSCLERCNQIVEIGAYTIGVDENRKAILSLKDEPTQFSKEGVDEILKGTFRNHNGEVITPTVYFKRDWYKKELEIAKNALNTLLTAMERHTDEA